MERPNITRNRNRDVYGRDRCTRDSASQQLSLDILSFNEKALILTCATIVRLHDAYLLSDAQILAYYLSRVRYHCNIALTFLDLQSRMLRPTKACF